MYVIGDKQMSDKEAEDFALEFGSDVKTLAEQSGWEYIEEEGKTNGPKGTPPAGPQPLPAGVSSAEAISLGLPGVELAIEDSKEPVTLPQKYNKKLKEITPRSSKAAISAVHFGYTEMDGVFVPASYKSAIEDEKGLAPSSQRLATDMPTVGTNPLLADDPEIIALLENLGLDPKNPNTPLTFTKKQLEKGFNLTWATEDEVLLGVNSEKQKFSDLFIDALSPKERKVLLKKGSRDEEFNLEYSIASAAGKYDLMASDAVKAKSGVLGDIDPGTILEGNFKQLKQESQKLNKEAQALDAVTSEWETRNNAFAAKADELSAAIKRAEETLPVQPLMPKFATAPSQKFVDNFNQKIEDYNKSLDSYNNLLEEYGNLFESEESAWLTGTYDKIINTSERLLQEEKKISTRITDLSDTSIMMESLGKNYSDLNAIALGLEEFFVGSVSALGKLTVQGAKELLGDEPTALGNTDPTDILQMLDDAEVFLSDYAGSLSERRQNLPYKRTYEEAKEENALGDYVWNGIISGIPTFAALFVPAARANRLTKSTISKSKKVLTNAEKSVIAKGYQKVAARQTMVAFAVAEGGGYLMQTGESIKAAEKRNAQIASEIESLEASGLQPEKLALLQQEQEYNENLLGLTTLEKAYAASMNALIATVAERVGSINQFQKFTQYSKAVGYRNFRKYLKPIQARWAAALTGIFKGTARGVVVEEIEESFTQMGSNYVDKSLGFNTHWMEGIDAEFLRQVAITSFVINGKSAGHGLVNTVKQTFATKAENKIISKKVAGIYSINDRITEIIASGKGPEQMRELRKLQQTKDNLLKDLLREDVNILSKLNDLEQEDLQAIVDADMEIYRLQQEAGDLMGSSATRTDATNTELEAIKQSIAEQVTIREGLLGKSEAIIAEKTKSAQNGAEAVLQLEQFNYSRALARSIGGDKYFEANSLDDLNKADFTKAELAVIERGLSENSNAVYVNGKTIVFTANSEKSIIEKGSVAGLFAANGPMHEFGHKEIRSAGIVTKKGLVGIGQGMVKGILDEIERGKDGGWIPDNIYNAAQQLVNDYKADNEGKIDSEELLAMLIDLTSAGVLRKSSYQSVWQIKSMLNGLLKIANEDAAPYFKIDNYSDAMQFVSHAISKFESGATSRMMPPEDEASFKESKTLTPQQDASVIDMLAKRAARIEEAKKVAEKFGVEAQADAVQQRLEAKIREQLSPLIGKIVTNRTKALYDPIAPEQRNNVSRDDFQNSLRTEIEALAFEEFKEGKQDIEKFLVNRAFLRSNNLASRLGIESAATGGIKKDIDTAKGIAVQEEAAVKEDKPKYKTLLERRILDTEIIDKVREKVKSTVRVMKTRMDAPVSKNVTVKPYIAELRKAMGKQADIDLKKAMGGKKDGELRKFLLRNKAAILENMTTTYLMTAMPNAIQKKVDGVWTSDWKGKKIDRESVDTDKAGRTSGAELVRRLPNASTRISDADYLSNILDASGAPIRGRKESLAKAIAEELSFDIISEALQDPNSEIRQAYKSRQDLLGAALTENYVTEVARDVERGNVKFSRTVASAFGSDTQKLLIWESGKKDLASRLSNIGSDISEKALKQELKAVYNDLFTTAQYNALAKELKGVFKNVQNANIEIAKITTSEALNVLEDLSNDTDFNDNIHRLVGAKAPVAELYRDKNLILEAKASLIEIFTKLNVSASVAKSFMQSTFADSGRVGIFYKDGSTHPKNQSRQDLFFNKADIEASLVGEGKLYTREEWDNAERVNKSTAVTVGFRTGNFDQAADAVSAKAAWTLTTDIVKSLKSYSPEMQAMIMAAMNSGTKTALRQAAPVTHRVEGFNSTTASDWRYEHLVPARLVLSLMYQYHVKGDKSIDIKALQKDYAVAIIPKIMDDIVRDAGLQERQIVGYKPGEVSPWKRYYNIFTRGAVQFAVTDIANGAKIGEDYAQAYNAKQDFSVNSKEFAKAVKSIKEIESAKFSKSPNEAALSKEFNNILERKTGVEAFKTFSAVQAQKRGEKKGRFKFFIAPSVDDFRGLVNYAFAGKGKQGEADMKWLEDNLMTPYAKGIAAINGIRQQIKRDFKTAVKAFPKQYQLLNKEIGKTGFTYDQAVRVYLWGKAGIKVPGLSQKDTKILQDAIRENPELMDFADAMLVVARRDTWMEPSKHWSAETLLSDLNSMTEKIGRKKYLEEFIANADAIFTEENLNKIEALYGRAHRDAIVDALYSMKNGTNRNAGGNKQVNAWLNWINGSTGAIMFFNRRSALLQMLSTVNFINYSDNNPLKAAAAFANQKQYWTDWAMIFNSDKLKERRGGLKQDVSSNEIASIANANKNSPQAILARLLQLGFTPTQIADSMAIASGGATFYRNRVNTYLKKGMTQKEAEQQAFLDFSKISDETQQSSDPALVSQVQRSNLGRLVFAFQNTPMQMTRLMKKDALDIINGRGDWRVKVARITYYGAIQNFIFSSLQSALFAMLPGFDDDDEDLTAAELDKKNAKEEAKIARVLNSMLDTLLRGSGVYGAVFSTVKNTIREYNKQEEKGFMSDHAYTVLSLFNISPPISSKARKIHSAIQTRKFEKDEIAARGWGVVADGRLDLGPNWSILGKVLSAAVSVPLDRVVDELTSISEAFDARNKAWQRIALALGWKTWDVGAIEENAEAIKAAAKKERKEAGIEKAKETRAKTKNKNRNTRNTRNTSAPRNVRK